MEVVRDLTCPICLEFYSHPVILPCSHVMCRQPCADQLFEGNFIRCPVCRDNCYVSGGLHSLPRVITLESIIDKVRAERKKRNASNQGQGRENSFDDVFSDVTSEGRAPVTSPVLSPLNGMSIISSSPRFPNGVTPPPSFSPRAPPLLNPSPSPSPSLSSSLGYYHYRHPTGLPSTLPSTSNCVGNPPPQGTQESASIDLPQTNPPLSEDCVVQNVALSSSSSYYSSVASHKHGVPHGTEDSSTFPFLFDDSSSSLGDSTNRSVTTNSTHGLPLSGSSTSGGRIPFPEPNTNSTSHQGENLTRNGIQNQRTSSLASSQIVNNGSGLRHQIITHRTDPASTQPAQHSQCNGITTATTSSTTTVGEESIQTSTPRSDLRNIRLCHEQSLANLRACSDSIKALQQSRPAYNANLSLSESICSPRTLRIQHTPHVLKSSSHTSTNPQNDVTSVVDISTNQNHSLDWINQSTPRLDDTDMSLTCDPRERNTEGQRMVPVGEGCEDNDSLSAVKRSIQRHLQSLCDVQAQLLYHMTSFTDKAQAGQELFDKGRSDINRECDSLVAEIENKRFRFLWHIDAQRKRHRTETSGASTAMQRLLASSSDLAVFVEEVLQQSEPQAILSTAASLLDSLSSAVGECQACLQRSAQSGEGQARHEEDEGEEEGEEDTQGHRHLIDTRLQRGLLQRLDYLTAPGQPAIDVDMCTRNASTVALTLKPPCLGDVIDLYEISYCSSEQKALGVEERYVAKMPDDPDLYGFRSDNFPVILIESLRPSTHYFFCACAVNRTGRSPTSDFVQCMTLAERDCIVPVPSLAENQCQARATSIAMSCPSLATVTSHQGVGHWLLQSQIPGATVWKGTVLDSQKEEFTVTSLRPGTQYSLCVVAYNQRGECQLSTKLGLHTREGSASCDQNLDYTVGRDQQAVI